MFAKFGSKRSKLYAFNQDELSLNLFGVLSVAETICLQFIFIKAKENVNKLDFNWVENKI
jgi:hypothetical protein